jgi:ankyrin repeat protein
MQKEDAYDQMQGDGSAGEKKEVLQDIQVLHLIHDNDYDLLKKMNVRTSNVNFLLEYPDLSFDREITPLILACFLGRIDCVRLILENPTCDIDLPSEDSGYTPLCVSCLTGNYEIVKMLLEKDAEVNLPNRFSQTPFILCFSRLNETTNLYENTKICFKMAEILLEFGADINWIVDKTKGHTILMQFCSVKMELDEREKRMNLEVIRFLLEHGADKNMVSNKNKNAFQLAQKHSNRDAVLEVLQNTNQKFFSNNSLKKKGPIVAIDKKKVQNALNTAKGTKK